MKLKLLYVYGIVLMMGCNAPSSPPSSNQSGLTQSSSSSSTSSTSKAVTYSHFAYVADDSFAVHEYNIDPTTGQMSEMNLTPSSVQTGNAGIGEGLCSIRLHPSG